MCLLRIVVLSLGVAVTNTKADVAEGWQEVVSTYISATLKREEVVGLVQMLTSMDKESVEKVILKYLSSKAAVDAALPAVRAAVERTGADVPPTWDQALAELAKLGALPPPKLAAMANDAPNMSRSDLEGLLGHFVEVIAARAQRPPTTGGAPGGTAPTAGPGAGKPRPTDQLRPPLQQQYHHQQQQRRGGAAPRVLVPRELDEALAAGDLGALKRAAASYGALVARPEVAARLAEDGNTAADLEAGAVLRSFLEQVGATAAAIAAATTAAASASL